MTELAKLECACKEHSQKYLRGLLKAREIVSQPYNKDTIQGMLEEEIARAKGQSE